MAAVFVDLDRTLLVGASGRVLSEALIAGGVVPAGRRLPGENLLYGAVDRFGENLVAMGLARAAALVARGWEQGAVVRAGQQAVGRLVEMVAPYAPAILSAYKDDGHTLVLATTTPLDMIEPFADAVGFDAVVATRYEVAGGRYTGRIEGGFVWGMGKLRAVRRWARQEGVDVSASHACSDSVFDVPLLSEVGYPHAVNPDASLAAVAVARRWPVEHWDRPPGVPSLAGWEPYHLLRPFVRRASFPYARFAMSGVGHIPKRGPAIVVANHRSYFDVAALALVAARIGRPVRFLAKKELFDAPVVGQLARSLGGIPVDREGGPHPALARAEAALRAGEVVVILPQGTIPRGPEFFDPALRGKTGAARLAASTGAPVIPVGLWGTENVWPRSSRLPAMCTMHPPLVTIRVGTARGVGGADPHRDTEDLMAAVADLLPLAGRTGRSPTPEDLARTYPPGHPAPPRP